MEQAEGNAPLPLEEDEDDEFEFREPIRIISILISISIIEKNKNLLKLAVTVDRRSKTKIRAVRPKANEITPIIMAMIAARKPTLALLATFLLSIS